MKSRQDTNSFLSFLTKIIYFCLVGGSGFFINYFLSYFISSGKIVNIWYIHASLVEIGVSMTSNFVLNKIFTFRDRNFTLTNVSRQYAFYIIFSLMGAGIQLLVLYRLVESCIVYPISLFFGVVLGSFSNFILNKKWTFYEKIWS